MTGCKMRFHHILFTSYTKILLKKRIKMKAIAAVEVRIARFSFGGVFLQYDLIV